MRDTTREKIEIEASRGVLPKRKLLAFVRRRSDAKDVYSTMLAEGILYETGTGHYGDPIMTHLTELEPIPKAQQAPAPTLLSDFWPGFVLDIDGGLWGQFIMNAGKRGLEPGQQLQALLRAYIDGMQVNRE